MKEYNREQMPRLPFHCLIAFMPENCLVIYRRSLPLEGWEIIPLFSNSCSHFDLEVGQPLVTLGRQGNQREGRKSGPNITVLQESKQIQIILTLLPSRAYLNFCSKLGRQAGRLKKGLFQQPQAKFQIALNQQRRLLLKIVVESQLLYRIYSERVRYA